MLRKIALSLLAAGSLGAALTVAPTEASAWYYYYYGWYPTYRPVVATYAQPVLVRRPVTTYTYALSYRPARVAYYAPALRPVAYAWRPLPYGARVVAMGK